MGRVGEENALFISATNKENFEELRERLYEVVRKYILPVFLTISFIS
jgi:GTP-binding protein HflX